jgi:hypothetical protein
MSTQKITINGIEIETQEITHLLNLDKKIEAIKLVHVRARCGLREAKDAVDQVEADHAESAPAAGTRTINQFTNSVFDEPKRKGSGVYVVIGIVLVLVGYFVFSYFN